MKKQQNFRNRKASFKYELFDTLVAGILLKGTEIKSIRDGKVSFTDAYCQIHNNEIWLKGLHIAEYSHGTCNNHDPKRDRKLLLNKREIRQWQKKINEKGFTIIPLSLFIDENGRAKLEIALARGKKLYDKRESLKQKDIKREMDRDRNR